jgi:hypothetical protein
VKETLGNTVKITVMPTKDTRSYHVSSKKIKKELGFEPNHTIQDAVLDLTHAFETGKIQHPMDDIRYYNIKTMQTVHLK